MQSLDKSNEISAGYLTKLIMQSPNQKIEDIQKQVCLSNSIKSSSWLCQKVNRTKTWLFKSSNWAFIFFFCLSKLSKSKRVWLFGFLRNFKSLFYLLIILRYFQFQIHNAFSQVFQILLYYIPTVNHIPHIHHLPTIHYSSLMHD